MFNPKQFTSNSPRPKPPSSVGEADFKKFISLLDTATRFPDRPHIGTMTRWSLKGIGPSRIKLRTWKIGGRRYTTQEAIDRFVAQLSGEVKTPATLSQQRADKLAQDERELDADGITGGDPDGQA